MIALTFGILQAYVTGLIVVTLAAAILAAILSRGY